MQLRRLTTLNNGLFNDDRYVTVVEHIVGKCYFIYETVSA